MLLLLLLLLLNLRATLVLSFPPHGSCDLIKVARNVIRHTDMFHADDAMHELVSTEMSCRHMCASGICNILFLQSIIKYMTNCFLCRIVVYRVAKHPLSRINCSGAQFFQRK